VAHLALHLRRINAAHGVHRLDAVHAAIGQHFGQGCLVAADVHVDQPAQAVHFVAVGRVVGEDEFLEVSGRDHVAGSRSVAHHVQLDASLAHGPGLLDGDLQALGKESVDNRGLVIEQHHAVRPSHLQQIVHGETDGPANHQVIVARFLDDPLQVATLAVVPVALSGGYGDGGSTLK